MSLTIHAHSWDTSYYFWRVILCGISPQGPLACLIWYYNWQNTVQPSGFDYVSNLQLWLFPSLPFLPPSLPQPLAQNKVLDGWGLAGWQAGLQKEEPMGQDWLVFRPLPVWISLRTEANPIPSLLQGCCTPVVPNLFVTRDQFHGRQFFCGSGFSAWFRHIIVIVHFISMIVTLGYIVK